ncbi:F-box/FBD/LRR-repeat protein At1g13570-like [Bidens hawaiensis]|uniref:F-box/FBD/LRR-repeat protein At1g13570-like n=1 Tax=Bidens hawaiensis TaxID=980011 RepID=UPI004049EC7A
MTENHKRRCVSYPDDEDIISNLPEDFINPILERLPIRDAVRTSILSKKWRYRWTTMTRLVIDYEFSRKFINYASYRHNGFIRTTNHIMINHKGPVSKFVLHLPKNIAFDSFQEVDQWMVLLSRKNVKILNIKNSNHKIYRVPSSVFSCQGLRRLALRNCIFKAPVEFQGFPNLEFVFLMKVDFLANLGGTVINLPQLKRLKLNSCVNVNNFNIKSETLRTLRVIRCPDAMLLRLLHSERLNEVCLQESIKNVLGVERFSLAMMLSKLPRIRYFSVDGYFLKVWHKLSVKTFNLCSL